MTSDLTTKAAEIRAGLVARLRRAVTTGEDGCGTLPAKEAVKVRPVDWHRITRLAREAAALIEQQAAELAEARAEVEKHESLIASLRQACAAHAEAGKALHGAYEAAESERDELLREKERHWGGIRECPQEPSGAGAIRTKHDLDYFDGHDADGDDEGSWEPWFDQFVTALGAYINCRDEQVTVRAAGDVFNVADAVILKAVEEHYWLFASGPSDDPTKQIIEMDGE